MKSIPKFTLPESFNRDELIEEALEVVRYAEISMGIESSQNLTLRQNQTIDILEKLQKEQVKFSPKLDIYPITEESFKQRNVQPSNDLKAKMKNHNFYQVRIPITLFPKSGWAFTRLECWLEFCPEEENISERPVIHEIFPEDIWTEILRFQDNINLGLNENLVFKTEIDKIEGNWQKISNKALAKVAVKTENQANLVIGPFSYSLRRSEVMARGRFDVECFWRLDGSKYVAEEDVLLGLVLAVPKKRKKPVTAKGLLKTSHDFQIFTADIFKDWIPQFSEILKSWLNQGAFITYQEDWTNILS